MDLGYQFQNDKLLKRALTHRSAANSHNERLEYLGDALLGFIVAEHLYLRFPEADEGQLTRARAALVNRRKLADIARRLDFAELLNLGEGERRAGGWHRESILANALEALIGAIYLDGGLEKCRQAVLDWFDDALADVQPDSTGRDPKTELQELMQARRLPLPEYETVEITGKAHQRNFTVCCRVEALKTPVLANGTSRRRAEQQAAQSVLALLRQEG